MILINQTKFFFHTVFSPRGRNSLLGSSSWLGGTCWKLRAWSQIAAQIHWKRLIGHQRKGKSASTPCLIHYSQLANEVGTVGAINYRWEKVGGKEREIRGIERGLPCIQLSFSMSMNIKVALCNLHAQSYSGNWFSRPRILHRAP